MDWRLLPKTMARSGYTYLCKRSEKMVAQGSPLYYVYTVGVADSVIDNIESMFVDPLCPTPDECILFEIEYGLVFPTEKHQKWKELERYD